MPSSATDKVLKELERRKEIWALLQEAAQEVFDEVIALARKHGVRDLKWIPRKGTIVSYDQPYRYARMQFERDGREVAVTVTPHSYPKEEAYGGYPKLNRGIVDKFKEGVAEALIALLLKKHPAIGQIEVEND